MKHLKSFSKIIYINTSLETIIERIDLGQERGLAVPDGVSISDVYSERKPLYERFAQKTIDGSLPVDALLKLTQEILNG
jgi:shikimate kinase